MIRSLLAHMFWAVATLITGPFVLTWTLISRDARALYRVGSWIGWTGVLIAGVDVETQGLDELDSSGTYIFMSNHTSNLDPPILLPLIPRRTSVLVKKELFRIPIFGRAMRLASLVPVDRSNRERAVESIREAAEVLRTGINMMIFVEGTRSSDGELLPFKKGPFYLAMETGARIVPVTIVGTHELQPKGQLLSRTGKVRVVFHTPIVPRMYTSRDILMTAVRDAIAGTLHDPSTHV